MRTLFLLVLLASPAFAADPIPNPVAVPVPGIVELSQVKAAPPRLTDIDSIDVGKTRYYKIANYEGPVTYEIVGDAVLFKEVEKAITLGIVIQGETEPTYPDVPAGSVILWGKKPGTVDLAAWGVVGGKPKKLLTKSFRVVGADPGPGPKPIDPVVPTAFESRLKSAVIADGAPKSSVGLLAALYRKASTSTVDDAGLKTSAELLAEMQRAVKLLGIPAGSMNATANAIADELDLTLKNSVALNADVRAKIKAEFLKVAAALEKIANG